MNRFFQFSLRALLVAMLVVAAFFGGMATQYRITAQQATLREEALEELLRRFEVAGGRSANKQSMVGQEAKPPIAEKPTQPAAKQKKEKDKEIATATGKLELEVKGAEKMTGEEKRVYTPEELIRAANSLAADETVVVQFKVRLVQPSPQTRKGVGKDDGWVVGHGSDDLCLYPQDRLDYTQKQLAAILTKQATQQIKRLGINDAGKHFNGKVIRVTGRITSYLPLTDDPVSERQFDLVIEDVSQLETVN